MLFMCTIWLSFLFLGNSLVCREFQDVCRVLTCLISLQSPSVQRHTVIVPARIKALCHSAHAIDTTKTAMTEESKEPTLRTSMCCELDAIPYQFALSYRSISSSRGLARTLSKLAGRGTKIS